jgi:hypothetical protein
MGLKFVVYMKESFRVIHKFDFVMNQYVSKSERTNDLR